MARAKKTAQAPLPETSQSEAAPPEGIGAAVEALVNELRTNGRLRGIIDRYLILRRQQCAESMLLPSMTAEQIQIVRGKAQHVAELAGFCYAAAIAEKGDGFDE